MKKSLLNLALIGSFAVASSIALADSKDSERSTCKDLPSQAELKSALATARGQANGGFNLDMWGTVVNRDGVVCAVAFTGVERGDQWPGSRVISAQKANTANAFSLPGLALSSLVAACLDYKKAIQLTPLRHIRGHRQIMENPMTL
jgi:hypothetical protein